MATVKKKYNLTDSANMLRGLASGDKSKQVDANGDGKTNLSDVSTMMKITAGWDTASAMDPYKGKEVGAKNYDSSQEYILGKVVNREPFEFSGTDSPIYKAYAKQYKREGDLAAKDTLSKVSARTGGVPSSYAVTATAAQQNQYAGALADKIPELYQIEYDQYSTDAERDRADLSTLMGVKSQDLSDAYNAAAVGDYTKLDGMGIDTSKLKENDALEKALTKYETTGDYSDLAALGFGTEYVEYLRDQERKTAETEYLLTMYQNTGDTRYLSQIDPNIDLTKILEQDKWTDAERKAAVGDYSGYDALGVDTSYAKNLQNQSLNSGSGSGTTSSYSDQDLIRIATKLGLGANYWDNEVYSYVRSEYGMEPIDVYYAESDADKTYYEVLTEALNARGISQEVISPDEWKNSTAQVRSDTLAQWGASSYDDYLRKVAYTYL